jgi:hypothetical protein
MVYCIVLGQRDGVVTVPRVVRTEVCVFIHRASSSRVQVTVKQTREWILRLFLPALQTSVSQL